MNLCDSMAESPLWLINLVTKQKDPASAPLPSTGLMAGTMFSSGRRNKDFAAQAGLLRRNGATPDFIEAVLVATNKELPDPLDEKEVIAIARGMARYEPSHIESINHKSFSELMLKELDGKCLYCVGDGFYVFKGDIWTKDAEGLLTLDSGMQITDKLVSQVMQMREQLSETDYNRLRSSVQKTQNAPFLYNAIKLFKAHKSIRTDFSQFNASKHLINLNNGAFNLDTGKLQPCTAEHRFTWKLSFDYKPDAQCPVFDKFLNDALPPDIQRLLLQLIACSLTANDKEQVFVFLHGATQNGKSTLVKVLDGLFQPLCANVEPSSFMAKGGDHIPNDLARLAGKRFVFTSETKLGNIMDAPLLKRMAGRDPMTVRFMRAEYFEFVPEFIPFIVTNYLPVIDGSDAALKRRILIIPFDKSISNDQVDKNLKEKLLQEKSGIFNRILSAYSDYQENGLVIPLEVAQRVEKYIDGSNLINRFFDECLDVAEGSKLSASELHTRYCQWSEGYRVKPMSEMQFKEIFERSTGIIQHYNSRCRYWPNVQWRRLSP